MPSSPEKHAAYLRNRYRNDPEYRAKHKAIVKTGKKKRIKKLKKWFRTLKVKCLLCPETEQCCLSFHHLNKKKKDITIAEAVARGHSIERIKKEIAKCIVLCENCHRKVHAGVLSLNV